MSNNAAPPQKRPRVLSGMRPTGDLHLGHLCGALKNWRRLQQTHDCFYFVADWHALTTDYKNPGALSKTAREMVITWLAVGIDPEKSVIFKQSDTPAHAELFVLLSMICPLPWLTRLPTYKEQQENLQRDLDTHGFLGYPLLQSADILSYRADSVPVGEDQLPHIEFTREIARRFNHFYGRDENFKSDVQNALSALPPNTVKTIDEKRRQMRQSGEMLTIPQRQALLADIKDDAHRDVLQSHLLYDAREILRAPEALLTEFPRLPGTDGRKMSKSYENTITLFEKPKTVANKLARMKTDSARIRRDDKGNPDNCPVWQLHAVFSTDETKTWANNGCRTAGIGCLDCKKHLAQHINETLTPLHKRRSEYEKPGVAEEILAAGHQRARQVAEQTLEQVRKAVGISE